MQLVRHQGVSDRNTDECPENLACLFPICFTQSKAGADGSQPFSTPASTSHNHTYSGAQSRFKLTLSSPVDTSPVNSQTRNSALGVQR